MVRADKRPKLSETDPERVWEKVNPLMYRVHHGQPLITSFDDAVTRERIRRTGWECLVKPFDEQTLLGSVGRVRKPV